MLRPGLRMDGTANRQPVVGSPSQLRQSSRDGSGNSRPSTSQFFAEPPPKSSLLSRRKRPDLAPLPSINNNTIVFRPEIDDEKGHRLSPSAEDTEAKEIFG